MIKRLTALYGAHPVQLPLMILGLALAGYAALGAADNPLWLRMLIWFAAAIVAHDLVLFPVYAAADGVLTRLVSRWGLVNYLRIPVLASALTLVLFLPGIIRQGADSYHAATGLTQQPFLARWLMLCVGFFAVSALAYLVKLVVRWLHRPGRTDPGDRVAASADGPDQPDPARGAAARGDPTVPTQPSRSD